MVKVNYCLKRSLIVMGCLLLLVACGGGGGDGSSATPTPTPTATPSPTPTPTATPSPTPTPALQLGSPVPDKGLTEFLQLVPAQDTSGEAFPGSANTWDLDWDFTLYNGYDNQFNGALVLSVTVEGNTEDFPYDQAYDELTWYSPELTTADGEVVATILDDSNEDWQPLSEGYSAIIAPGIDNRISQVIDLTDAVAPIYLSATVDFGSYPGWIELPDYRALMVVRDLDGTELTATDTGDVLDLTPWAGQQVVVSFELTSQTYGYFIVDDVSVMDDDGMEYITDGGFESGTLDSWTVSNAPVYQNVASGERVLNGLTVTRSFYTTPGSLWGRWVDMFTNDTGADITATIEYTTYLGAANYAVIYPTPSANDRALTIWDGGNGTRDVGLAFGQTDGVPTYTSDTDLGAGNAADVIATSYTVTVPAGQSAAIANFIVMSGIDTGESAVDASATADVVDGALQGIVNDFWTDFAYRNGMTQAQIDALINF